MTLCTGRPGKFLLQHLFAVRGQLERCPQQVRRAAAHEHPLQKDLEMLVHPSDIGVDLQVQRDDLFFRVDLQGLVRDSTIDPVMDVKAGFGLLPHTAAAHVGLVPMMRAAEMGSTAPPVDSS